MLSQFKVWFFSNETEREAWRQAWSKSSLREPFAHPSYVNLFARPGDQACCASLSSENGIVLFPLIVRPLELEPWGKGYTASDITSPYGYGGPYAEGNREALADEFWPSFENWARSRNVVTLFTRLSLFPQQLLPFPTPPVEKSQNIIRTLELDEEAMWSDYHHKVRKNVNRAIREGVSILIDTDGQRLEEFIDIYHGTMARRQANQGYFFDRAFFETIVSEMTENFVFFHAIHRERIVSTELVLFSAHHVYSYLGGTHEDAFHLRPNDLLKHEIIRWGRASGKSSFVLGGGYQPGDGIYQYKKAFTPSGDTPFHVGQMIFDSKLQDDLVDKRKRFEKEVNQADWIPSDAFFPVYRM